MDRAAGEGEARRGGAAARRGPLILGLAVLLSLLCSAPSLAATAPPPELAFQRGDTVVTASGRSLTLPPGQVLGRRGGEWIVVRDPGSDRPEVLAVRGDHVRSVFRHRYDESATGYALFPGSDLVVEDNYQRSGTTYLRAISLDGARPREAYWDRAVAVGADADSVYVSAADDGDPGAARLLRWTPGEQITDLGPAATLVDAAHDLAFVRVAGGTGPTPLSAMGAPAWTAAFAPRAVSPDGQHVAGVAARRLEVRSVADGGVVVSGLRLAPGAQPAWEPDGDVLAVVAGPRGRAITRCSTAGDCARVTPWTRQPLSLLS